MIANNYTEFAEKIIDMEINAMNNTEEGRDLSNSLLSVKLKENPNMTQEEWNKAKQQFLLFAFLCIMKETPELMQELSWHIWNELKNA